MNKIHKYILLIKLFFYNLFSKNKRLFIFKNDLIQGVLKLVPIYQKDSGLIGYNINTSYFYFNIHPNRFYSYLNSFFNFNIFYRTSLNDCTNYKSIVQLKMIYFITPNDKKFPKHKFLNNFDNNHNLFLRYIHDINYNNISDINNLIKNIEIKLPEYIFREDEFINLNIMTHQDTLKIHLNRFALLESFGDEPALIHEGNHGFYYCKQYYKNGKLHREDGPAVINTFNEKEEKFYINGLLHNEDNAAIVKNSSQKYYLYGKEIKPNRFKLLLLTRFQKSSKIYFNFE